MNGTPSVSNKGAETQTFTGGVQYPVDKSSNKSTLQVISPYAIMSCFTQSPAKSSEPGMTLLEQCGAVCHAIESYNNDQGKSGNNGYVMSYTTTGPDYWKGASPMKIVGLTLRVWCSRHTSQYTHNGNKSADKGQTEYAADNFINKMHAVYIKPDGSMYNKELLPEGNNSGKYKFYRKDKLSDNYHKVSHHKEKAFLDNGNPQTAKLIRVWHGDPIPDGDCFMGFHVNWGIGKVKNKDAWHNLFFGGVSPILETDLQFISSNSKLNDKPHTTPYMNYLNSKDDLYKYYPELDIDNDSDVSARKLWTVNDSNHENNHGTTHTNYTSKSGFYQQSFSFAAGNMDYPDL